MLQGDVVRQLKQDSRPELEVKAAIAELKKRKKLLEQTSNTRAAPWPISLNPLICCSQEKELAPAGDKIDRSMLEGLVKRRFYYGPSFSQMDPVPVLLPYYVCILNLELLAAQLLLLGVAGQYSNISHVQVSCYSKLYIL